jgi:hypothetical protein
VHVLVTGRVMGALNSLSGAWHLLGSQAQKTAPRDEVNAQRLVVGQLELAVLHLTAMADLVGDGGAGAAPGSGGSRWREMLNARAKRLHERLASSMCKRLGSSLTDSVLCGPLAVTAHRPGPLSDMATGP